jgi:hypothetical protein
MFTFRSRKQHPSSTCNSSRVGPHPWVYVRGRPWSSVAVDVPTDVDQETLRSRALTGCVSPAEHLILGRCFSTSLSAAFTDLDAGTGWHPVGLAQPDHPEPRGQHPAPPPAELAMLAPGAPVVALGEVDGMPPPLPAGLDARVSHPGGLPGCGAASARSWFR